MPTKAPRMNLAIRKLADRSQGQTFDPTTGAPEPWPLAGIAIEGDLPKVCRVPTSFVDNGRAEGWIEVEGEQIVTRPGGPPDDLYRVTHTFRHLAKVTLLTVDGPITFTVTHQPDKYADPGTDATSVTPKLYDAGKTRVDHFYDLTREG